MVLPPGPRPRRVPRRLPPARLALPQSLRGDLGATAIHDVGVAASFLRAQVDDVRAEEQGGGRGRPQERDAADGRHDGADREGGEEQHGRAAAAREHLGAPGARGLCLGGGGSGAGGAGLGGCRGRGRRFGLAGGGLHAFAGRFHAFAGGFRTFTGGFRPLAVRFRELPGGIVMFTAFAAFTPRVRGASLPGRRHAGVPDVHPFGGCVRVDRVAAPLVRLGRARLQVLGVPALHARPAGEKPDGGAEAFRRTSFVQLVLPTEPHRHQVGGPGPDDDCVDEAAAAHGHTVEGFARGHPPIESVCRTIWLIIRAFLRSM